jgi:hypothetical protein
MLSPRGPFDLVVSALTVHHAVLAFISVAREFDRPIECPSHAQRLERPFGRTFGGPCLADRAQGFRLGCRR